MKKIPFIIYSIITIGCLLYGVPMALFHAHEYPIFFLYLGFALTGIVLLLLGGLVIYLQKRKNKGE